MINWLSLRAQRSNPCLFLWIAASALCLLAMTGTSTFAQEEQPVEEAEQSEEGAPAEPVDPSVTYSPDFCEFEITFPDEPYSVRRCEDPQTKERCYDLVSYTQVYEMSATVNFRVICNPVDESVYEDYSAQVMEATLKAMTKDSVVDDHQSAFREEDGYKQAGLVGEGKVGAMSTIYIAQLWIGKQSAFSVQAELIGEAHDTADQLFSDILKSVGYTGEKPTPLPPKTHQPANQ
ncbi:MAG: hypothetical protein AAF204_01595 [Pseudomonadota bacterium]